MPLALALPTRLGTNQEAPTSGMIPRLGPKTNLNFADSEATIKSPDRAKPTPPPAAIPFIAVITGLSIEVINLIKGLKPISILFAPISPPDKPSSLGQPPFARSAPEQNPLPSPVIIITLESFSFSISWKIS